MDVNEAYTSKTNSWTGEIMNVGSREWITVDGLKINRDINGARGILLRALGDSPALQACVVNES
jgi:putative transposase